MLQGCTTIYKVMAMVSLLTLVSQLSKLNRDKVIIKRHEAYLSLLVDLVLKEVQVESTQSKDIPMLGRVVSKTMK